MPPSGLKKLNKIYAAVLVVILLVTTIGGYYYFLRPLRMTSIMIGGIVLTVELAETSSEQVKGLSDRNALPSDHGMLFVFDHEDYWGFWMKDMKFPLDIIWFDATRDAVFIETNLQACSPNSCPVYIPTAKSMYVLEVDSGFVAAHDVALGTNFVFLSY